MISCTSDFRLVIAGHGSRDPDGIGEFERLVALMRDRFADKVIEHGYLEFAQPTISHAVSAAASKGGKTIVVVPALLAAATHAKNDMPAQLTQLRKEFPDNDIHFAAAMDLHPLLLRLCRQRIVDAEATSTHVIARKDTCLVVVGRGTSDSDANGDIAKLARMLQEGMGFGHSFVCFSGTAEPLVADGLKSATAFGCKRLIVLPYFLFDGVLVKRIYAAADDLQKKSPQVEVLKAGYLGVTPEVADVFVERAHESVEGRAHMNCSMCKYRVQIVGFEEQVGLPQTTHQELNNMLLAPAMSKAVLANPLGTPSGMSAPLTSSTPTPGPYVPHPIELESFEIIRDSYDWSKFPADQHGILQRLVHTTGDFECVDDVFFSPGAVDIGIRALLRCRMIVTDVTMVQTGIKRASLSELGIGTWCGVHDEETRLMAQSQGLTRSAAGIRRAWQKFGNDVVVAIGDAPTALVETVRLIKEQNWRPQLVIGLPVGFVGTRESKDQLRRCLQVARITNSGTRGGSPWAAATVNALLISALNMVAESR